MAAARKSEFTVDLNPIQWALVSFYAKKRNTRPDAVVEWMIDTYASADRQFDANAFIDFVRTELLSNISNRSVRDRLLRQAVGYSKGRQLSEETTASHAATPEERRRPRRRK